MKFAIRSLVYPCGNQSSAFEQFAIGGNPSLITSLLPILGSSELNSLITAISVAF
jgi:hypothetical protein